jgi:hypothetical protein
MTPSRPRTLIDRQRARLIDAVRCRIPQRSPPMPRRPLRPAAALIAAALLTAACASPTISKRQELTDLRRALNEGAITEREYAWLRGRILQRPH